MASGVILRLLLDQNFPKPPGFDLADVDATIQATHVFDHDPGLVASGVPDWLLYLRAADDGFDAIVTRDWHQLDQPEELWYSPISGSPSSPGGDPSTIRSPSGAIYSHTCPTQATHRAAPAARTSPSATAAQQG